ncbi:hypothetical protein ACTXT7_008644 [Hymenolepis weldensis]
MKRTSRGSPCGFLMPSRSSESARDCRKRKALRIQYLAESVRLRELTVLKMRQDVERSPQESAPLKMCRTPQDRERKWNCRGWWSLTSRCQPQSKSMTQMTRKFDDKARIRCLVRKLDPGDYERFSKLVPAQKLDELSCSETANRLHLVHAAEVGISLNDVLSSSIGVNNALRSAHKCHLQSARSATSTTYFRAMMMVQRFPEVFQESLSLCNHCQDDIKTDAECSANVPS